MAPVGSERTTVRERHPRRTRNNQIEKELAGPGCRNLAGLLARSRGIGSPRPQRPARSSSRTFAAWPSARTLYQRRTTLPSPSTTKVERIVPTVFFPYMVFSPQAPYACITSWVGSERSGNERPYFSRNLTCFAAPSGEIPTTFAPERWNADRFSLN